MRGPKPSCLFHGEGGEIITERHVQAIWYDRAFRPARLTTTAGEEVRVVYPGEWNLGAGPDFRQAVLEIGDERRRFVGDVEIHLNPSDWEAHGHGTDAAYANVIAHATWRKGIPPPSLPSGAISIWLGRSFLENPSFSPEQIDLGVYPFARMPDCERPCFRYLQNKRELAEELLEEAGRERLQVKARRLRRLLADGEREQVLYEEMMGAFGYHRNVMGFRAVARAVPYALVREEPENISAAFETAAEFTEWSRGGMRPGNRPDIRLRSAAAFFTEVPLRKLLECSDFSEEGCAELLRLLTQGGHFGRGRASAILANVLVPFALAEGRLAEVPARLPPEDVSAPVRLTAFRLFGRDHNPAVLYAANGVRIQGLIQIHRNFCLQVHPDCGNCGLVGETELAPPLASQCA